MKTLRIQSDLSYGTVKNLCNLAAMQNISFVKAISNAVATATIIQEHQHKNTKFFIERLGKISYLTFND